MGVLDEALKALEGAGVPYVVVGGLASLALGRPRRGRRRALRFEGDVEPGPEEAGLHRRYRFRLRGQAIDAVVTEAAATTWRQAHPGAAPGDLDAWARRTGEDAIRRRLLSLPVDVSDVYLDRPVGPPGGLGREGRPRYGEVGGPRR